ncbi:hypothetical protein LAZ67_12002347 [Cordylochernes scorpioides]|uniref:Ig-like domain-containing protein n=1 Tax=Cordylochernes scorpioides TaxID=51811 RepID=A0ABY6L2I2_9ARAC|nr:hypothetical protein LAZ67_12002347 [Cordylochernes scorpioides]
MEEQTEQSNDATGLSVLQQKTTFEEEEMSPPQGTSADPLTQIADALSKLLVARSPREIDVSPYDGTFEAQSFFDNFDAQADRAELTYTDRLHKLPCYLQGPTPRIQPFQFPEDLTVGSSVSVSCTELGGGRAPVEFRWEKDGAPLRLDPARRVQNYQVVSLLQIDFVAREDAGNYTCLARNPGGRASFTAPLHVKDLDILGAALAEGSLSSPGPTPRIQPFQFPEDLTVGSSVSVSCTELGGGRAPVEFRWEKDGAPLRLDPARRVQNYQVVSLLQIDFVAREDAGNYTCLARNPGGRASFTAPLHVKGR